MKANGILIVGEHTLMRAFVRAWLKPLKGLSVLAESAGGPELMGLVARWKPKLLLMDMATLQGLDLGILAKLKLKYPQVKVIIYFAYAHDNVAIKAIQAGAAGYVVKSALGPEMENAIRTVLGGGVYLSPEFLRFVGTVEGLTGTDGQPLSKRQAEILKLIALGLSTKDIAFELKVGPKTVDAHKQGLVRRLGLKRSGELFKYAIAAGLIAVRGLKDA